MDVSARTWLALLALFAAPACAPAYGYAGRGHAPAPSEDPPEIDDIPVTANATRSVTERDSFFAGELRGYHRDGHPATGQLDHPAPIDVNLRRGRCYVLALRLEADAEFSDLAERGLRFWYTVAGATNEQTDATGPGLYGPGALVNLGCPQANVRATVGMAGVRRAMLPASSDPLLGHGAFSTQLYSRAISAQALARDADRAFQQRLAAELERTQRNHAACSRCVREREQCRDRDRAPCLPAFDACVRAHVEQAESCP